MYRGSETVRQPCDGDEKAWEYSPLRRIHKTALINIKQPILSDAELSARTKWLASKSWSLCTLQTSTTLATDKLDGFTLVHNDLRRQCMLEMLKV
jgi:hypothetical protein